MWTTNIALLSLSAGLGLCIPNEAAARSHLPIGDADMDPSASQSMLVPHSGGPDHPISMGNGAVGCTSDSSKLNALLASGGAMSTVRSMTDMAVFTFSHANTMESGSGHSTTRGANAVDLYKHHGLSRLRRRGVSSNDVSSIDDTSSALAVAGVLVFLAMMVVIALVYCRACRPSVDHEVPPRPVHVRPADGGPAMGYPVIAPIMTADLRNRADQIGLPVMPSSPIRPDISTLGSTLVERRTTANNGGNTLSSVSPSRSVASDSSRLLTDRY
ncbi:hypothetical protein SeLEV6574_g08333 [Synchytrium endobioticum]|uniref:Mid2 domain-containing protein n=1 Tax=Synchytrium endobioticum TaxID=286115 RepID=A0A507C4A8_9FUNG|nr:hypothetical protein SeLEV6574_g08333 [Synchytrium endobioticum]